MSVDAVYGGCRIKPVRWWGGGVVLRGGRDRMLPGMTREVRERCFGGGGGGNGWLAGSGEHGGSAGYKKYWEGDLSLDCNQKKRPSGFQLT